MDFDNFYDESDDDEECDEFLFQSIQRYNTLQMFRLENVPFHLLQTDDCSICVSSKRRKGENSELLKLKLPGKLSLPPEEEGRSKENDFKVLSGIYTENFVHQIDKFYNTDKIITSEKNSSGLHIYSFTDSSLGNKNEKQKLDVTDWITPDFAVIQETTYTLCSKCCSEPIIQVDLTVGKKVKEIKHSFCTSDLSEDSVVEYNNIKCKALSKDLIAILNTCRGDVVLHDLRTNNAFTTLSGKDNKISKEIWTLSGCDYRESSLNYFGTLSSRSSFCIYDKRKNSVVTQNTGDINPSENFKNMKLKFNSKADKFSISGINSVVDIFKINKNDFQHEFTHIGHSPSKLPTTLVNDHIWLQTGGNEYIVSVSNNGTLNCWDYKTCNS